MNASVAWLRELAPSIRGSPRELAELLSVRAVPVDGVRSVGEGLGDVVVARALEVGPHPDADRLLLCRVDAGTGSAVPVVCGAPVVEEGALYPYIPPGGTLPGGMRVERRTIRGVESHGMLCSEHELGLGRDRGGILRLPADAEPGAALEPGTPLAEALALPDALLVLDLTPNRVDLACHLGVARELAPGGEADLTLRGFGLAWEPRWADDRREAAVAGIPVSVEDGERCPRYLAAVVRGVRIAPSPAWLAGRLRAVGLRPVNNVVDATNYVLLERNQPLHAFDLARLRGPEIRVRAARPGERLRTLDGEDRALEPAATVIADAGGAVALAGVMGGEESEVTAETTDVLLECAAFGPLHVRRTARSSGLATEASYRFERGIDESGLEGALARCVELILTVAGGEAESGAARVGGPRPEPVRARLRRSRIRQVLGIEPDEAAVRGLLEPLGFRVEDGDGGASEERLEAAERDELLVRVPGWRRDVTREIDLIEEVARRHGYERFPTEERRFRPSVVPDDPAWARADRARRTFVARGFLEARSSSFVPEIQPGGRASVKLLNPLSAEEAFLRAGIVPTLLRKLEHNWARGRRDVRLFEIGTAFAAREDGTSGGDSGASGSRADDPRTAGLERFHEELRVGAVLSGRRRPPSWTEEATDLDVWDLKGLAEEVADALCAAGVEPAGDGAATDAPGGDWLGEGSFRIVREGRTLGVAGPVRADALDAPPWAGAAWALEFLLEAVVLDRQAIYVPVPPYPAVRRDLAITTPRDAPAAALERGIREAAPELLESVTLFDVYEGEGIEPGRRSLAWALRFRSAERTLTDEEADDAVRRIVSALEEAFDARVRSS